MPGVEGKARREQAGSEQRLPHYLSIARTVWLTSGLPCTAQNCLGVAPPRRSPLPPAGSTAATRVPAGLASRLRLLGSICRSAPCPPRAPSTRNAAGSAQSPARLFYLPATSAIRSIQRPPAALPPTGAPLLAHSALSEAPQRQASPGAAGQPRSKLLGPRGAVRQPGALPQQENSHTLTQGAWRRHWPFNGGSSARMRGRGGLALPAAGRGGRLPRALPAAASPRSSVVARGLTGACQGLGSRRVEARPPLGRAGSVCLSVFWSVRGALARRENKELVASQT